MEKYCFVLNMQMSEGKENGTGIREEVVHEISLVWFDLVEKEESR